VEKEYYLTLYYYHHQITTIIIIMRIHAVTHIANSPVSATII